MLEFFRLTWHSVQTRKAIVSLHLQSLWSDSVERCAEGEEVGVQLGHVRSGQKKKKTHSLSHPKKSKDFVQRICRKVSVCFGRERWACRSMKGMCGDAETHKTQRHAQQHLSFSVRYALDELFMQCSGCFISLRLIQIYQVRIRTFCWCEKLLKNTLHL